VLLTFALAANRSPEKGDRREERSGSANRQLARGGRGLRTCNLTVIFSSPCFADNFPMVCLHEWKETIMHSPLQRCLSIATLAIAIGVAATALAACSSTVYEGKYAFKDGWRRATVVSVVAGEALQRRSYWRCTKKLEPARLRERTYVVVWYVAGRTKEYFAVEASGGESTLQPGERVYVNVWDCGQPPVATVANKKGST
jgi:hypothetical protein